MENDCSFHAQGPTQPVQDHLQHVQKTYAHTALLKIQFNFSSHNLLPAPKWIRLLLDEKKYADITSKADSGVAKQALLKDHQQLGQGTTGPRIFLEMDLFSPHLLYAGQLTSHGSP